METSLRLEYDREGDILHIDTRPPYANQITEELGDDVVARLNPATGEVENLELLFFSSRLADRDVFDLPLHADIKLIRSR